VEAPVATVVTASLLKNRLKNRSKEHFMKRSLIRGRFTTFDVSSKTETSLTDMQIVVNGIASAPVTVNVQ